MLLSAARFRPASARRGLHSVSSSHVARPGVTAPAPRRSRRGYVAETFAALQATQATASTRSASETTWKGHRIKYETFAPAPEPQTGNKAASKEEQPVVVIVHGFGAFSGLPGTRLCMLGPVCDIKSSWLVASVACFGFVKAGRTTVRGICAGPGCTLRALPQSDLPACIHTTHPSVTVACRFSRREQLGALCRLCRPPRGVKRAGRSLPRPDRLRGKRGAQRGRRAHWPDSAAQLAR